MRRGFGINHPRSRTALGGLTVVLALALSACSSDSSDGSDAPSDAGKSTSADSDWSIAAGLDRISADAIGDRVWINATDNATLAKLIEDDPETWDEKIHNAGAGGIAPVADQYKIFPNDATYAVNVGEGARTITIIHGGQDTDAIKSTAEELGYQDEDGVLTTNVRWLAVNAKTIKLDGEDVILGKDATDLGWVDGDGDSVAKHEDIAPMLKCLEGSVAIVMIDWAEDGKLAGVGILDADGTPGAVVCGTGDEKLADKIADAMENGKTFFDNRPYSDLYSDPQTSVVDGKVAKVTAKLAGDTKPFAVIQSINQADIPGFDR